MTENRTGLRSIYFFAFSILGMQACFNADLDGQSISNTASKSAASLSFSSVNAASNTIQSGRTDTITLIAKDETGSQLPSGGLTVLFSNTGGTSTGNFGPIIDHGNGTYTTTFTGFTAGSTTQIKASINGQTVMSSSSVTVTPGALASFSVTGFPTSYVAGTPGNSVTVTAYDLAGNPKTDYTGTVTLTSSDSFIYPATNSHTFSGSTYTFNVSLSSVGTQSLTASDSGISNSENGIVVTANPIINVATNGNDSNPGTQYFPVLTLNHAISLAPSRSSTEIDVCGGTYSSATTINLNYPVSLKGGFSGCTSPPWINTSLTTTLNTTGAGVPTLTVTSDSAIIPNSVFISGFTINGGSGSGASAGILLTHSAVGNSNEVSPTISGNTINGGSGTYGMNGSGQATSILNFSGSYGIEIYPQGGTPQAYSKAIITNNTINGGSGSTNNSGAASVGIAISAGGTIYNQPNINNNTINGGSGQNIYNPGNCNGNVWSMYGSLGIWIDNNVTMTVANGNPLATNTVNGGTGSMFYGCATTSNYYSSHSTTAIGTSWSTMNVDFIGNQIYGGRSGMATPANTGGVVGIYLDAGGGVYNIKQNLIYGGDNNTNAVPVTGIMAAGTNVVIDDNMIYAGSSSQANPVGLWNAGIRTLSITGLSIAHNTIYVNSQVTGGINADIFLASVLTNGYNQNTSITNNILIQDGTSASGIFMANCEYDAGGHNEISTIQSNTFVNSSSTLLTYGSSPGGTCTGGASFTRMDLLKNHLVSQDSSISWGGNIRMDASSTNCSADNSGLSGSCVFYASCSSPLGCIQTVFPSWTGSTDNGYTLLTSAGSWSLAAGAPCAIVDSTYNQVTASPIITSDYFGNPRTYGTNDSEGAMTFGGTCM